MREGSKEDLTDRPGWAPIIEEAKNALERDWSRGEGRCEQTALSVREGRLHLEVANPNEACRGVVEAARALSAEVCEVCGGRGDPVGDGRRPLGCRCEGCRVPGMVRLERDWPRWHDGHAGSVASPAIGVEDRTDVTTGVGGDSRARTHPDRFEARYRKCLALLMSTEDDERAMRGWTANPGWAGLVRALVVTMQLESGDQPSDTGRALSRLPYTKEGSSEEPVGEVVLRQVRKCLI